MPSPQYSCRFVAKSPESVFLVKRLSVFARDLQDLREKRDGRRFDRLTVPSQVEGRATVLALREALLWIDFLPCPRYRLHPYSARASSRFVHH